LKNELHHGSRQQRALFYSPFFAIDPNHIFASVPGIGEASPEIN
jgi:hypothetical protein